VFFFCIIYLDVPNVRIYFTVDGSKPDPFQVYRTGNISTYLYRGAFRLGSGKRIVKAIAVTKYILILDVFFLLLIIYNFLVMDYVKVMLQ